jgi:hypothetical protein
LSERCDKIVDVINKSTVEHTFWGERSGVLSGEGRAEYSGEVRAEERNEGVIRARREAEEAERRRARRSSMDGVFRE